VADAAVEDVDEDVGGAGVAAGEFMGRPVFCIRKPAKAGSTDFSKLLRSAEDQRRPSLKSTTIPVLGVTFPSRVRNPSIVVRRRASLKG